MNGKKENSEQPLDEGQRKTAMEKQTARKRGRGVLLLMVVVILGLCAFCLGPDFISQLASGSGGAKELLFGKHLTGEIIKEQLVKQTKLVTYTKEFEVTINLSDNAKIPWTDLVVPGGKRELSIKVPVTVDITTDLEAMGIEYDDAENSAVITLPRSEIFRITPDISQLEDEGNVGLFRRKMTADEQKQMVLNAEDLAREHIDSDGLMELADHRAADIVTDMAKRLGVKHAETNFQ